MAYSETKVIIGGFAHVPILIFIVNLIKQKFEAKTNNLKGVEVKEEELKSEVMQLVDTKEDILKTEELKVVEVKEEENQVEKKN